MEVKLLNFKKYSSSNQHTVKGSTSRTSNADYEQFNDIRQKINNQETNQNKEANRNTAMTISFNREKISKDAPLSELTAKVFSKAKVILNAEPSALSILNSRNDRSVPKIIEAVKKDLTDIANSLESGSTQTKNKLTILNKKLNQIVTLQGNLDQVQNRIENTENNLWDKLLSTDKSLQVAARRLLVNKLDKQDSANAKPLEFSFTDHQKQERVRIILEDISDFDNIQKPEYKNLVERIILQKTLKDGLDIIQPTMQHQSTANKENIETPLNSQDIKKIPQIIHNISLISNLGISDDQVPKNSKVYSDKLKIPQYNNLMKAFGENILKIQSEGNVNEVNLTHSERLFLSETLQSNDNHLLKTLDSLPKVLSIVNKAKKSINVPEVNFNAHTLLKIQESFDGFAKSAGNTESKSLADEELDIKSFQSKSLKAPYIRLEDGKAKINGEKVDITRYNKVSGSTANYPEVTITRNKVTANSIKESNEIKSEVALPSTPLKQINATNQNNLVREVQKSLKVINQTNLALVSSDNLDQLIKTRVLLNAQEDVSFLKNKVSELADSELKNEVEDKLLYFKTQVYHKSLNIENKPLAIRSIILASTDTDVTEDEITAIDDAVINQQLEDKAGVTVLTELNDYRAKNNIDATDNLISDNLKATHSIFNKYYAASLIKDLDQALTSNTSSLSPALASNPDQALEKLNLLFKGLDHEQLTAEDSDLITKAYDVILGIQNNILSNSKNVDILNKVDASTTQKLTLEHKILESYEANINSDPALKTLNQFKGTNMYPPTDLDFKDLISNIEQDLNNNVDLSNTSEKKKIRAMINLTKLLGKFEELTKLGISNRIISKDERSTIQSFIKDTSESLPKSTELDLLTSKLKLAIDSSISYINDSNILTLADQSLSREAKILEYKKQISELTPTLDIINVNGQRKKQIEKIDSMPADSNTKLAKDTLLILNKLRFLSDLNKLNINSGSIGMNSNMKGELTSKLRVSVTGKDNDASSTTIINLPDSSMVKSEMFKAVNEGIEILGKLDQCSFDKTEVAKASMQALLRLNADLLVRTDEPNNDSQLQTMTNLNRNLTSKITIDDINKSFEVRVLIQQLNDFNS
jgi:hypothetical protein